MIATVIMMLVAIRVFCLFICFCIRCQLHTLALMELRSDDNGGDAGGGDVDDNDDDILCSTHHKKAE